GVAYCLHTLRMKWKGSARVISWSNHQKLGVVMLPMLLIWGTSAFSFGFHKEFEEVVNVLLPVTGVGNNKSAQELPAIAESSDTLQMLDSAEKLAFNLCPGKKLSRITLPGKKGDVVKFFLTNSTSHNKVEATEVDLNMKTGKITAVIRPESRTAGDVFLVWLPRMHFGNFAGVASKIIWCVIGFTPLLMAITGMIMWWSPSRKSSAIVSADH
ncbi:MAG: PepSY domain-containing protein, partial [Candidatus Obscuribacterales bacterium]|nr:PepSY domain-containing protein [Candidatus Obscuribacterales bacterium]